MIGRIEADRISHYGKLYLDYIAGAGTARDFFSHSPLDFRNSLEERSGRAYPRQDVVTALERYNGEIDAHGLAMENIGSLLDEKTFCVITGQQAGFLGGPVYTLYKIVTAIRLASHLECVLRLKVVPIFWLASEDHDFDEVNHAFVLKGDDEVGRIQFSHDLGGRPVEDLPVTPEIKRAYDGYLETLERNRFTGDVKKVIPPPEEGRFCTWIARIWAGLFSHLGLVILEPAILRGFASGFFKSALKKADDIKSGVETASRELKAEGYDPVLLSPRAGELFTFDGDGRRIRVDEPNEHIERAVSLPESYSADVLLRPLLADSVLPVVADVLGPGEISYHACLKPIYGLFGIPQPILFPRKSYTVVRSGESELMERCGASAEKIITGCFSVREAVLNILASSGPEVFDDARNGIKAALSPLLPYVEEVDPNLGKAYEQASSRAQRALDKLEERTLKAMMSKRGLSKGRLQRLHNSLLPKDSMQERIFPLPHFINFAGRDFIDTIMGAGELTDFSHNLIDVEDDHG